MREMFMKKSNNSRKCRKRRKLSLNRLFVIICSVFFLMLGGFYGFTSTYLKSYNISLSLKVQEVEAKNEKLKNQIDEKEQELIKIKKKIKNKAHQDGILKDNPNNVYIISNN